jgi:hypothetical protein
MVPFQVITDSVNKKSVISSSDIGWKSAEGFKNYYIRLNYLDTDTLYLDVAKISVSGKKCTSYQYNSFRYNGQEIELDAKEYNYLIKK